MARHFRKDYHNKKLENPFFRNRKNDKKPKQRRLKFSISLLIIAVFGWFIFLFYSSYFEIESIDFGDTNKELEKKIRILLNAEFEKQKFTFLNNQNYFVFDTENLKDQLGTIFLLNELKIEKRFPNTLLIKAKEKSDVLALLTKKDGFFVDKKGLVVDKVPENFKTYTADTIINSTTTIDFLEINPAKLELSDEIIRKMPVVIMEDAKEINIRDEILSEEAIIIILEAHQNLLNKLGVSPKLFKIEDFETKEAKMTVITKNDWEIYFLLNKDIENQLENLKVILNEKVGNKRELLEYIDLRFGDKVYYKVK